MFDFRPAGYTIGLLIIALGAAMGVPMIVDFIHTGQGQTFALSAFITGLCGLVLTLACQSQNSKLNIQQTFILTTGIWVVLPFFGALPFMFGTDMGFTDAFFEAMSGFTTTGATVINNLETLPKGLLLWRALMQWFGGIGVIVVAMVFLPILRIGGMQIFRLEGFDTFGKILPRAAEIARSILGIYLLLTFLCFLAYSLVGLGYFDAISHAMTTIATGGFANYDASFAALGIGAEYVAIVFMILAALPFVRYVQMASGRTGPLFADAQVRGFMLIVGVVIAVFTLWQVQNGNYTLEVAFRKAAFNGVSLLTGTGFVSDDYMGWGGFAIVVFFLIGLVGGCAGSTTCSIKVFRFQLLFASVIAQIQRFYVPSGVFQPHYQNRAVSDEVISSVMAFFVLFMASLAGIAILLGLTGLDMLTAISGAAAALANIGPGLGDIIGPAGNYSSLTDSAKWILSGAMVLGRLELMAVYILFSFVFWRG